MAKNDIAPKVSIQQFAAHLMNTQGVRLLYSDNELLMVDSMEYTTQHTINIPPNLIILVCCKVGSVCIRSKGDTIYLEAGEVALLRSGYTLNQFTPSKDFQGMEFCMTTSIIQRVFHQDKEIQQVLHKLFDNPVFKIGDDCMDIMFLYKGLIDIKLQHSDRRFAKQTLVPIICSFIYELFAEVDIDNNFSCFDKRTQGDILFKNFISILSNQEIVKRELSYYADQLCVTPKYLSLVCKKISGMTAVQWINEKIVEAVRYHLESTDMTIKDICIKFDFPNLSFFGKYVKRYLGHSPYEYRQYYINNQLS